MYHNVIPDSINLLSAKDAKNKPDQLCPQVIAIIIKCTMLAHTHNHELLILYNAAWH